MTGRDKINAGIEYLKSRKVGASTAAPPLWRLCWSLGIHVPPPHFLGFFSIALFTGAPFGLMMSALLMGGLAFFGTALSWTVIAGGVSSAVFFGGLMAAYYRWSAWRLGLPSWTAFEGDSGADDETW